MGKLILLLFDGYDANTLLHTGFHLLTYRLDKSGKIEAGELN
jgi:hypothetical protein